MTELCDLLVIGGRSGVGKSAVGFEVSSQLGALGAWHALIEGDFLDFAYPPPGEHHLAEKNLAVMWPNYRQLGYRRLIYINTLSVLFTDQLVGAMGGAVRVTSVVLSCTHETASERLSRREVGSALAEHVRRSQQAAVRLEAYVPADAVRVGTDGQSVVDIASRLVALTGWAGP